MKLARELILIRLLTGLSKPKDTASSTKPVFGVIQLLRVSVKLRRPDVPLPLPPVMETLLRNVVPVWKNPVYQSS